MTCPHCGTEVIPGNAFCQGCRKRVLPPGVATTPTGYAAPNAVAYGDSFPRPGTVTFFAILDIVAGLFCLLGSFGGVFMLVQGSKEGMPFGIAILGIYGVLAIWYLVAGIGLLTMKSYGRIAHMALCFVGLLAIPVGTILSALMLVYFFKPGIKIMFSGRAPRGLTPQEAREVEDAGKSSVLVIAAIAIVALLFVVAMIGIIAAIAIPSLLRARVSANESTTIGDIRTVISGEVAYSSVNQEHFDTIECLIAPTSCIPEYAPTSPVFLDPGLANPVRHGYTFEFHAGPAPSSSTFDATKASPSSMASFAYVGRPTQQNRTGVRAFCGDMTGRICVKRDGAPFDIQDGVCPMDCEPLN